MSLFLWLKKSNPSLENCYKSPVQLFLPDPNRELSHEAAVCCAAANEEIKIQLASASGKWRGSVKSFEYIYISHCYTSLQQN